MRKLDELWSKEHLKEHLKERYYRVSDKDFNDNFKNQKPKGTVKKNMVPHLNVKDGDILTDKNRSGYWIVKESLSYKEAGAKTPLDVLWNTAVRKVGGMKNTEDNFYKIGQQFMNDAKKDGYKEKEVRDYLAKQYKDVSKYFEKESLSPLDRLYESVLKEELKVDTKHILKLKQNNIDFTKVGNELLVDESDAQRLNGLGIPYSENIIGKETTPYEDLYNIDDEKLNAHWNSLSVRQKGVAYKYACAGDYDMILETRYNKPWEELPTEDREKLKVYYQKHGIRLGMESFTRINRLFEKVER